MPRSPMPSRCGGGARCSAPRRSDPARRTWSPPPRSPTSTGCRCCCCPATSMPAGAPTRCCSKSRTSATATSRRTTACVRCRAGSTASPGRSRSSTRCPGRWRRCSIQPTAGRQRWRSARTCRQRPSTIPRTSSRAGSGSSADSRPTRARSTRSPMPCATPGVRCWSPAAACSTAARNPRWRRSRNVPAWRSPKPRPARARYRGIMPAPWDRSA